YRAVRAGAGRPGLAGLVRLPHRRRPPDRLDRWPHPGDLPMTTFFPRDLTCRSAPCAREHAATQRRDSRTGCAPASFLWRVALVAVLACGAPLHAGEPAHAGEHPLVLDATAIKEAGIIIDKLTPRTLADELKVPGEVRVDAYSTVLVSPRVASQVLARK